MPVFEYRCGKCRHVTSFLEKPNTSQSDTCERCDSKGMDEVFSALAAKSGTSASSSSRYPAGTCPLS